MILWLSRDLHGSTHYHPCFTTLHNDLLRSTTLYHYPHYKPFHQQVNIKISLKNWSSTNPFVAIALKPS